MKPLDKVKPLGISAMTEITNPGCKELLVRRMLMAIVSSIAVQFLFTSCIILITSLRPMHPLSWIQDALSVVSCLRMWCYFLVLAGVILLQGIICSKNYLNAPPYVKSRFDAILAMFAPHNFVVASLYATIGFVLVWLHLSLEDGDYGTLTKDCQNTKESCLVEEHYFLLLGGLWIGMYFFAKANFSGLEYLCFPIIPQAKFIRVKRDISATLPVAVTSAVWPVIYFLGSYYCCGEYLREIASSTLFLRIPDDNLGSISRLLDPFLVLRVWLYATLFVLTINTMHLLFQAHLTEWMAFDIDGRSVFNEASRTVTLSEVLAMDKVPIMRHLGYLDLVTLAQKDKSRRSCLFSLSQPGGHPYNWNCVVEKCLALINTFAKEMKKVSSSKQEARVSPIDNTTADVLDKSYAYRMRNLVAAQTADTSLIDNDASKPDPPSQRSLLGYFRNKRDNFVSYLLSKPLIFYFFGQQSDGKIRHLLINAQTVIWAADAISSLAVASLKEDPYGIVQKDLPSIVETLLTLKQSLDKLHKTNLLMRKPQNDDKTIRQILTCLRMAIKRSIYRIVSNFKDYIDDLALEPKVKDQLQSFLAYRE